MDISTHIRLWIGAFFFCIFLGPLIKSGQEMEAFANHEVQSTRTVFGGRTGEWIIGSATKLFDHGPSQAIVAYAKLGTVDKKRADEIHHGVLGPGGSAMVKAANSYFTGLILIAYIMAVRMLILAVWFGVLSPIVIAALIDGFSMRAVRFTQFNATRPAAFSLLATVLVPMAFAPLIYLVAPFHVDPALVPLWVLICAIPIAKLIEFSQPIFTRY